MNVSSESGWTSEAILEVAERQKLILWMILISFAALFFPPAIIVVNLIQIYFIFKLAQAVRSPSAWIYIVLSCLPFISLIALLYINGKATKVLKENEINVGLMGADPADLKKIKARG